MSAIPMDLIDEKGRLFGVVNVVDALVVLVVLADSTVAAVLAAAIAPPAEKARPNDGR